MGKLIEYINENLSLQDEYKAIFGRDLPSGKFICPNPMHSHVNNTPSCKAYGNKFKCFGQCNRIFGVYDLLKWYNPKRIDEIKTSVVITDRVEQDSSQVLQKVSVSGCSTIAEMLNKITGICPTMLK